MSQTLPKAAVCSHSPEMSPLTAASICVWGREGKGYLEPQTAAPHLPARVHASFLSSLEHTAGSVCCEPPAVVLRPGREQGREEALCSDRPGPRVSKPELRKPRPLLPHLQYELPGTTASAKGAWDEGEGLVAPACVTVAGEGNMVTGSDASATLGEGNSPGMLGGRQVGLDLRFYFIFFFKGQHDPSSLEAQGHV